jgi:hypothetical protein
MYGRRKKDDWDCSRLEDWRFGTIRVGRRLEVLEGVGTGMDEKSLK